MEDRQRIYTVMAVVAVVAIVLSCLMGAIAGAIAGLFVGQEQGRAAAERVVARELDSFARPEQVPMPFPMPRLEEPPMAMEGAIILKVIRGTPAAEAGLRPGDVIVSVDRTPVDATHELSDVLAQYQPRDRIALGVWRGGERTTMRLVLGAHPDQPRRPYLGIRYQMSAGLELPNE